MELPKGDDGLDAEWPPRPVQWALKSYAEWDAWYSGNVSKLAMFYGGTAATIDAKEYTEYVSPLAGGQERAFWGVPVPPESGVIRPARLHAPIAADIASAGADLVIREMPKLTVVDESATQRARAEAESLAKRAAAKKDPEPDELLPGSTQADEPTQQYLDELVEEESIHAALFEAEEIASAYGESYMRIRWDTEVAAHPFLKADAPKSVIPEWRSGRLLSAVFWKELDAKTELDEGDRGKVYRYLERHSKGRIEHALYLGDSGRLGKRQDLREHPYTEQWVKTPVRATGATWATAFHYKNVGPDRDDIGGDRGRSDLADIVPLMHFGDETWTSYSRDIRHAKSRIIVPDNYLRNHGKGKGASVDLDHQEVFTPVSYLPGTVGGDMQIEVVQFAIRFAEHDAVLSAIGNACYRGAGFNSQTFGDGGGEDAPPITATEVSARSDKSNSTRLRKIAYRKALYRQIFATLLEVAIEVYKPDGVKPIKPRIEFPDGVSEDPEMLARTAQLLKDAGAASTYTLVQLVNRDWSGDQIKEEVLRIQAEESSKVAAEAEAKVASLAAAGPGAAGGRPGGAGGKPANRPAPRKSSK